MHRLTFKRVIKKTYSFYINAKCELSTKTSFSRAKLGFSFDNQHEPALKNEYLSNPLLSKYLKRNVPENILMKIEPDLQRFGLRVATEIYDLSRECEENPPKLIHFDGWGKRRDRLVTCEAWNKMKTITSQEGLLAIAYERDYAEWSRLYQLVKVYLFSPSSGMYSCPLAASDGAAKTIEPLEKENIRSAFYHLISRDPKEFWTSGQWMTEKRGGSDVAGGTETIAVPANDDDGYRLYGYKWFTSVTDSDMTLTLARTVDSDGKTKPGTRGLSMFYLETHLPNGELNNLEIVKLKNKLGTRQLPTSEILLDGTIAHAISLEGRGVLGISNMLTITRIHNALASTGYMRRIISLARDYATKREAFGKKLFQHSLYMSVLAKMEVEVRGCEIMCLDVCQSLSLQEGDMLSKEESDLLRLLVPITKLYTGKMAIPLISEGLEAFGGQGYIEDTGLPSILRDAQVTPIWEGTTNILSLDVLRAAAKTKGDVFTLFERRVLLKISKVSAYSELKSSAANVLNALNVLKKFISSYNLENLELPIRDLSFTIAKIYAGALLLEHAAWEGASDVDVIVAKRWCLKDLALIEKHSLNGVYSSNKISENGSLVMEGYIH